MDRRTWLIGSLGLLAAPLAVDAQQAGKISRIGFLFFGSPAPSRELDAFRQGLREHGYIEGQNIAVEYRFASGEVERLPELAAELVRLKVDVIVTPGTPPSLAAKQATSTIPIGPAQRGVNPGSGDNRLRRRSEMRMLLDVKIPHETFNAAVRDGSVGEKLKRILEATKPEAVYFTERDGQRGAIMIVNLDDPSKIPAFAEPWFLTFNADVEFRVAMTPEDLARAGLDALGKKWAT